MRLLKHDADEDISFTDDLLIEQLPPYAILSHTCGYSGEITFEDIIKKTAPSKQGYGKILFCMQQAHKDGLRYIWVDTCCIDEAGHGETTEMINSSYHRYANAEKCYVYLSDVHLGPLSSHWESDFRLSRWFTRGWTLQELLAPKSVEFFSSSWKRLGSKTSLERIISEITGIPARALQGSPMATFSIEERFSWQLHRYTTREEDECYSLLGIMGVSMPIIYGEGRNNAFRRLEKELAFKDFSVSFSLRYDDIVAVHNFVARQNELREIRTTLSGDGSRSNIVLHGIAGIGKTHLALAYAMKYKEDYSAIFWLSIKDDNSVRSSFVKVAEQILREHPSTSQLSSIDLGGDVGVIMDAVMAWLSMPYNRHWLLIFDNYDHPVLLGGSKAANILDYLPAVDQGSVIIITRSSSRAYISRHLSIEKLDDIQDSLSILERSSRRNDIWQDRDAERLARKLDGIPLELNSAGAYLYRNSISCAEYLHLLETTVPQSFAQQIPMSPGPQDLWKSNTAEATEYHLAGTEGMPTLSRTSSASSVDTVFSMTCVASSAGSVGTIMLPDNIINHLVELLFCTPELLSTHSSAISEEGVGEIRYQRTLRRMIANYGKALISEPSPAKILPAARLLQSRKFSVRAARSIIWKARQQSRKHHDSPHTTWSDRPSSLPRVIDTESDFRDDASVISSSDDESELHQDFIDERAVAEYMKGTQAFLQFKAQLLDLAHLRYAERVQASLTLRCDVDIYPNQELVLGIGHEISWIPPHLLHFDEQEECGIMDHLKAWVEDSTGEEWDWWPFQQCRRAVRAGDMRVKWQTPCGNPRSIDVPRSVALALQDTLTMAPAFLSLGLVSINGEEVSGNPPKGVSCAHSHASSPAQTRNVRTQASTQQQLSGHRPQPSKHSQTITSAVASNGQAPGFELQNPTRDPLYVYLCVWKGNRWRMSKLKIHKYITDARVFSALRRKYIKRKGTIGRWLSCWQYSYCQFYQFSKYPYGAAPSIVGFPPDKDDVYEFIKPISPRPSPQTPFGPITQEEFRDRFYTFCEDCCHSWHRKQMRNWLPTLADEERIKVLPKRKEELQWADRKAEAFWGLKVCERICGIRVTAYMVLFNTPAIVFFFLWLFNWTHPSDLQNASVPFFASITLTVAFVSWITRNRKGDLYG